VSGSQSPTAINSSVALQDGALVVGDGTAIGENNNGAIASGDGSLALNGVGDSGGGFKVELKKAGESKVELKGGLFNDTTADVSLSYAQLDQTTTGVYMTAGALDNQTPEVAGGGGTLTTGTVDAGVSGQLGVSTSNLNTGIMNQGASVGVSAVASAQQ
jgi:hypothetical protein